MFVGLTPFPSVSILFILPFFLQVKLNLVPYKRESPHFLTPLSNEGVSSLPSRTDVETEKQWQLQQQAANKGTVK